MHINITVCIVFSKHHYGIRWKFPAVHSPETKIILCKTDGMPGIYPCIYHRFIGNPLIIIRLLAYIKIRSVFFGKLVIILHIILLADSRQIKFRHQKILSPCIAVKQTFVPCIHKLFNFRRGHYISRIIASGKAYA